MVAHARKNNAWPLYVAFVVEILFLFYKKGEFGFVVSPILLITAGLFLAVWPYFMQRKNPNAFLVLNQEHNQLSKQHVILVFGLLAAIALLMGIWIKSLMLQYPINIKHSDIIPFIEEVYLKRFALAEPIYAEVDGYGYGKGHPGYMPFHWMFFVISYFLNIDHRWIPFAGFIIATAIYTYVLCCNFASFKQVILLMCLPLFVLFTIYFENGSDAMHTIEILVLAYYLILGVSLFSRHIWAQALALSMPILSRYALVFWLPVHFLNMLPKQTKRFFLLGFSLLGIVLLILLPFLIQTPDMFNNFNSAYAKAALGEWNGQDWQQPGDKPFQLFRGLGLASWYYEFYTGTLIEKIEAIKQHLFYVSVLGMLVLLIVYRFVKDIIPSNLYSLLALKISLTLFYAFMIIPYNYLNWLPMMISVVILSRVSEGFWVQTK